MLTRSASSSIRSGLEKFSRSQPTARAILFPWLSAIAILRSRGPSGPVRMRQRSSSSISGAIAAMSSGRSSSRSSLTAASSSSGGAVLDRHAAKSRLVGSLPRNLDAPEQRRQLLGIDRKRQAEMRQLLACLRYPRRHRQVERRQQIVARPVAQRPVPRRRLFAPCSTSAKHGR